MGATPTDPPTRTRDEKRQQLAELETALADGRAEADAVAAHCERHGLSLKRGRADLDQVRGRLARRVRTERDRADANRGLALLRLERLYASAAERGDDATAVAAEVEMCRLLGLYPNPERKGG